MKKRKESETFSINARVDRSADRLAFTNSHGDPMAAHRPKRVYAEPLLNAAVEVEKAIEQIKLAMAPSAVPKAHTRECYRVWGAQFGYGGIEECECGYLDYRHAPRHLLEDAVRLRQEIRRAVVPRAWLRARDKPEREGQRKPWDPELFCGLALDEFLDRQE